MAPTRSSTHGAGPRPLPLAELTWPEAPGARALRPVLARHARGTVRALAALASHDWPPTFARDLAEVLRREGALPRGRLAALARHVWISGPLRVAQADAARGAWGPAGEALAQALVPLATSLPGRPISVPLPPRPPSVHAASVHAERAAPRELASSPGPVVLWPGGGAIAALPPQARRVQIQWPGGPDAPPELTPLDAGGEPLAGDPATMWATAVVDAAPAGRLALADNNPLRGDEAHPDKAGNLLSLGGASPGTWIEALRLGHALVASAAPALAHELRLGLQHWVPVGADAERHLSASFQEVVGLAYLSLHAARPSPSPAPAASRPGRSPAAPPMSLRPGADLVTFEAMVHEFQHNKLNAAVDAGPLLHNALSPLYASPVRPDPRPLHGVLLAAHAFVPVERVYDRLAALGHPAVQGPEAARRLARIRAANDEAMETLTDHAQWTPAGESLWRGLLRAHRMR